jgi:Na+/melibiose symporter-like transporter
MTSGKLSLEAKLGYGVGEINGSLFWSAGIGMSAHYVMPWSIFPDTVEYGYLWTGERNEGMYYGIMNHRTVLHRRQCRARLLSPHPRAL